MQFNLGHGYALGNSFQLLIEKINLDLISGNALIRNVSIDPPKDAIYLANIPSNLNLEKSPLMLKILQRVLTFLVMWFIEIVSLLTEITYDLHHPKQLNINKIIFPKTCMSHNYMVCGGGG